MTDNLLVRHVLKFFLGQSVKISVVEETQEISALEVFANIIDPIL